MWLFLHRHPEVRHKKAHNLLVNRAMCSNPAVFKKWFEQYKQELESLNITSPEQIWNCDETGCQDVPKEWEVVGETGVDAYTIVSKEQGETTTVVTFANAVGKVCPPVVIHKGSQVQESWCLDAPVGVMVRASVNGWINKDIFLEYATRWLRWMHTWKLLDRPHLLLLDVHKSHVYNIWFLKLMKEFNIGVLAIPSHTSHKIQPLDDVPFVNFKNSWNENLLQYFFGSVGCGMPKMDFFQVFWPAWKKAMTVANIQAGFRQTGIFPVNANAKNPALPRPSRATDNITNLTDEGKDNLWNCYISVDTFIVLHLISCFRLSQ